MSNPIGRPAEIKALNGARALPPLVLVLFHFCEGHGYRHAFWFDAPVAKGYLWVEFFFALSGFILIHVYGGRAREFWRGRAYLTFLRSRLARLYPMHIATLLLVLALVVSLRALAAAGHYVSFYDQPWHPIVDGPTLIANLFLVQAWNIFPYLSWNGVAWFVSVEFLLCLLFPVYLLVARGGALRGALLVAAGLAGLNALAHGSGHGLDLTFHNGIFRGMAAFAVGVGLSLLYRAAAARVARLPASALTAAQIAMLALLVYATYRMGWAHHATDIYTAVPMLGMIFVLSFDRGLVANILKGRFFLFLGERSFAIYLSQTIPLQFIHFAEQRLYPAPAAIVFGRPWSAWSGVLWWAEPFAVLAAAIGLGLILYPLVERPANALLRPRPARAPLAA